MRPILLRLLVAAAAGAAIATARADTVPLPQGVLNLTSSASVEVPRDQLQITFSTTRDGPDAGAVQSQLKQALDAALAEARKAAKPGQVDVQTGIFSLSPRYSPKGGITGWQGTAELVVEGRDIAAISQLAGRIATLTVARAAYSLSREAREKAEADASAQAIARWRAHAADYAKQFGYSGYTIGVVAVNGSDVSPPLPRPAAMRAMAQSASSEDLPVEAGRAAVTVTVSGSVQLK